MAIRESAEMYLETILVLSKEGIVRAIDIARTMNFSRPSVSIKIHNLQNEGYLNISEKDEITLTEKGKELAETIYERHTVISAVLMSLGVSEKAATEDACKIEHDISAESFEAIKKAIENNKSIKELLNK